jgi:hypothetical protein
VPATAAHEALDAQPLTDLHCRGVVTGDPDRPGFQRQAAALEITPFRKLLYSSDAYGLAEFRLLGAVSYRHGLGALLQDRVDAGELSLPDALRIVRWTGSANARRLYGLPAETVHRRD